MVTLKELSTGRVNSITFLRLIAALAVIYSHSYAIVLSGGQDWVTQITGYAHAGGVAVDFFFLLSGFLVTASIRKRGVLSYLVSRVLRLFPALWAFLLIMVFFIGPIMSKLPIGEYYFHAQTWNYFLHLGGGLSTEWFLPGVFEDNRSKGVNGSIWSVILEIRMYLYLALFYILGVFRSRLIFNSVFGLLVVMVWSGSLAMPGISGETDIHVALLFAIGCFLNINKDLIEVSPLLILVAFAVAGATHGTEQFQYGYILVLVLIFCVTAFLKHASWMDRFGDYSYGVYLWGWPVQQVMASYFPQASAHANALMSMVIAFVLAFASWHLIEKRVLTFKVGADDLIERIECSMNNVFKMRAK